MVMPASGGAVTPAEPVGWNQLCGTGCRARRSLKRPLPACQETLMRTSLITTLALVAGLSLAACNTVGGAGKDMSSAGKAVTKTANDAKN
jgi:predicted small secreted protein